MTVIRPELPPDAGLNTLRLDLALTRDELAVSLGQLISRLKPRALISAHPLASAVTALAVAAAVANAMSNAAHRTPARWSRHG